MGRWLDGRQNTLIAEEKQEICKYFKNKIIIFWLFSPLTHFLQSNKSNL